MRYIENDPNKGILIDWDMIRSEFLKLNIPKYVFNPYAYHKIESGKYIMDLGERSTGKTTQWLLLGLILNKKYDVIIQYVRKHSSMIAPKVMDELFTTIIQGGYIEKITDGRWNSVIYFAKKWRYCNRDENGMITEKCEDHFMYCMSLDENLFLKSSYNAPRGDLIIFDEFLGGRYEDDHFYFHDILKTIVRDRESPVVVMVANTINKNSEWFDEYGNRKEIQKLKPGQTILFKSKLGTELSIAWVENKNLRRNVVNTLFFGWDSPKMASITGGGWSSERYQHIPPESMMQRETVFNKIYLLHYETIIQLELVISKDFGLCVFAHPANTVYDDSIIYSRFECLEFLQKIHHKNAMYLYGYGAGSNLDKLLWKDLRYSNRWFYANSETYDLIDAYCSIKNPFTI